MTENEQSKISQEEALQLIGQGKSIEGIWIEKLAFKDQVITDNITITNCRVGIFTIQNCTFKAPINCSNVTFLDKIDFNVEPGHTHFEGNVVFDNCVFEGEVNANGVEFSGESLWEGAKFAKRVAFPHVHFRNKASFARAQFLGTSRFEDSFFHDSTSFMECVFRGKANFKKADFKHNAYFRKSVFDEGATFENTSFQLARFEDMQAREKMVFKVATFQGKGYFHRCQFQDDVVFRGCTVRDAIYWSHMLCQKEADFCGVEAFNTLTIEETRFCEKVDFSKCIFHRDAYMRGTVFEKEVHFQQAVCNMRLDCSQVDFKNKIRLASANTGAFVVERAQIEGRIAAENDQDYEGARQIYSMLRRNFETLGNHDASDWAYYNFRRFERKSQKLTGIMSYVQRFSNWLFFDIGSGYGTRPFNVAILAFFVILFFTGVYWAFGSHFLVFNVTENVRLSVGQAFYISAMTFTTLGTEGIAPKFDTWLKYFMVTEGFLGLFLMTVFVGVYTRKMAK